MSQIVQYQEKLSTVGGLIRKLTPQIAAALPRHMTPERMARVAFTAAQMSPDLLDCTPQSLALCVLGSAQLGLEMGPLGHAYLIPYKDKNGTKIAQLIVGYRGMIDLARRSGQLSTIYARIVHKGDHFEYAYGLDDKLAHTPAEPPGEMTHAYAVAKLRDGGRQFEVMTKREIDAIRQRSRASGSGPWVTDYEEMAKKTVIRRLFKMLPVSIEIARATSLDEAVDSGIAQDFSDVIDTSATEAEAPARTAGDVVSAAQ